jgi:hypothetical protein
LKTYKRTKMSQSNDGELKFMSLAMVRRNNLLLGGLGTPQVPLSFEILISGISRRRGSRGANTLHRALVAHSDRCNFLTTTAFETLQFRPPGYSRETADEAHRLATPGASWE